MIKKRVLGFIIAAVITIGSVVPAVADETGSKDPGTKAAKIEAKQIKQKEKAENQVQKLAKFQEKATKLGINIDGLTLEEARAELDKASLKKLQAKADKLGVDITDLSKDNAKVIIRAAIEAKKQVMKTEGDGSQTTGQ